MNLFLISILVGLILSYLIYDKAAEQIKDSVTLNISMAIFVIFWPLLILISFIIPRK
jgi:uncharacterized membrane protein